MPAERTDTLAYRAAVYFGVHDQPRTSIKVGRAGCLIVLQINGRTSLMHYDEEYKRRGTFVKLTDRQVLLLREALFFGGVPESENEPRG